MHSCITQYGSTVYIGIVNNVIMQWKVKINNDEIGDNVILGRIAA